MVLPSEISIKQEKEDFEHDFPSYLNPEIEVTVKVEVESSHVSHYEVKTEFTSDETSDCLGSDCESPVQDFDGVDYEELIEYTRLKCTICDEEFYERYSLVRHNLEHLRLFIKPLKNLYQCASCLHYFLTKNQLSKHIAFKHNINNKTVIDDEKIKTPQSLHRCKLCGKIQTYKTLHSHMKEVHGTDEYECTDCGAVFKCARYLRKHINSIHLNKKFKGYLQTDDIGEKCSQCPAVLRCKNALKTHIRNCHSEKAQCRICKSVMKSQSYLHAHMRRVHYNDGKDHECFCGKKFQSPRYLKIHKKNAHKLR